MSSCQVMFPRLEARLFYQRREISFWWSSFVQGTWHVSLKVSQFSSCNQSKATSQRIVYWKPLLCLYSQQYWERVRAGYQIHFWIIMSPFIYFLYDKYTSKANWWAQTPSNWVSPETLTVSHFLMQFLESFVTRRFVTVFARARHWSLSWAWSIQPTTSHKFLHDLS
jgi:hypothetical protein